MNENSLFVKANGIEIFCRIEGEGFPLVFLHGNGETHEIFEKQITFFKQYYQVIAIDTRGHGLSKNNHRPLSFPLLASDLKEIFDDLGIKKAHLVGFSDGGNIALQFASTHYNYIEKMLVIGANAHPNGLKFKVKCWVHKEYYEAKLRSLFLKKYKNKANVLQLMTRHPNITRDELQLIKVPTLILLGDDDVITNRHIKYLNKNIKKSLVFTIPNASHFLIKEYPELFNEIALEFFKSL